MSIRPGALSSLSSAETSPAGTGGLYGLLGQVGQNGFPSAGSVSVLRAAFESQLTGGVLNFLS